MTLKNRIASDPPTNVRVIVTTLEIDRTAVRFRFTGMQDFSIESPDRQAKELHLPVGGDDTEPPPPVGGIGGTRRRR
jgi:hypothetical protein